MINNRRGVTLPEVVIVIGIIGIVATIAIPRFQDILDHYRLKGAAREIATSLQLLRIKAIAANADAYLEFTPGTVSLADGFYTAFVDLDNDGTLDTPSETDATGLNLNDALGGYSGTVLPTGVSFGWGTWGTDVTKRACSGSDTSQPSSAVTFSGDRAKFQPSGVNATLGTVYLTNASIGQFYAVTVSITGRVKLCRWNGSAWA